MAFDLVRPLPKRAAPPSPDHHIYAGRVERKRWYRVGDRAVQPSEMTRVGGLWLAPIEPDDAPGDRRTAEQTERGENSKTVQAKIGGWAEVKPAWCPPPTTQPSESSDGHLFDPVEVGWIPCASHERVGHRSYRCKCGTVVLIPPLDEPECPCERRHRPPAR